MMHKKFFLTAGFLLLAAVPARAQQTSGTYTPTDLREYIRQHLALNQAEIYKRVQCPALILQGERDSLVLAHHAVAAAKALADAGNKQVSVRIFPNLSHIFTPSPLDRSLPAEKKNEIGPEALETVQKWVVEVVIGHFLPRKSNSRP